MARHPGRILRLLFRAPVCLYRCRCGFLLGRRFLLLVHSGRRTGRRRETLLEIMEYRENGPELVAMSAYGRGADWLRNLEAAPDPEIVVAGRRFVAAHRILDADEAVGVVARYERRNRLFAPLVRMVLSRFLGWPYRGSDADRRRLTGQLPLVAFRPKS